MNRWEPFKLDESLQVNSQRLAQIVERAGYKSGTLSVCDGHVLYIALYDDEQHFVKKIRGDWCELRKLEGGIDETDTD